MAKKLQIGLIGAGRIAREAHIPAWSEYENEARIEIVADIDAGRAKEVSKQFGIPRWTSDIRDIIETSELDAVDICLPAPLHAEAIMASLSNAKHVLTEKPFVLELEDAFEIVHEQEKSGKVLMVAQNWIYSPGVRTMETLLGEGILGEPTMFVSRYESPLYLGLTSEKAMLDRLRYTGGGFTMAAGVHPLNLALHLLGNIDEVTGYMSPTSIAGDRLMDRGAVVNAKFHSGAVGSFSFTGESRQVGPRVMEVQMHGTHGAAELDIENSRIRWSGGGKTQTVDWEPSLGFSEEIQHFIMCVNEGCEPKTSGRNQIATVQLISCIYETFATGSPVKVPSLP
ncbi:MAG: Gfo/Idh/MocA family oxidoreductase [Nitrososphaerota archaeon]|jgi:predicted dehydrogenase|nr:Gfo/Idh/MocA family oxidoreductase [Nitrososphaerota archaeon]